MPTLRPASPKKLVFLASCSPRICLHRENLDANVTISDGDLLENRLHFEDR